MGLLDTATKPLREARRVGRWATDRGIGLAGSVMRRGPKDLDDTTIARKVESEVFRLPAVQKGKIDVNVADGIVYLRGTAKNPSQVKAIVAKARAIPEVRDVENLLHLPKTPARRPRARRTAARSGAS